MKSYQKIALYLLKTVFYIHRTGLRVRQKAYEFIP